MTNKAKQLYEAYQNNEPLQKGVFEFESTKEAYQVQDDVLAMKEESGEQHQGYKISLTSQETQDLFNSDSPLFGQMTDQTVQEGAGTLSLSDYNEPLLELELVFLVEETVHADDSDEEVMQKCRVAPGFEVPDGRYEDWFPNTTFHEVIADGAVNGAVVVGTPAKYTYEDLDDIEAVLYLNDQEVKRGSSTEVLGHPVNAVKWLASALEERGEKLVSGRFVSSGTFVLPERLQVGEYKVVYETLGDVHLTVTE
ncbi:hydratase [Aerococcaceae bacterium DSM 111020]|nr:hydratase [Aerococcaceae bacterium DSM 111020]